jgi:MFS family permease
VLLLAFLGLAVAAVPVARGRLTRIEHLRFRHVWAIALALVMQIVVISVVPGPADVLHLSIHLCSYVLGAWFLYENRRMPGIWLMGLGASLNITAIVANGGIMPAAPSALTSAGLPLAVTGFKNSIALSEPRLLFLGDIFAVPASLPLHNVFSIGDVALAFGAAMTIHAVCGSRLIPSSAPDFGRLLRDAAFVRLWSAQVVSNLGDWSYTLATAAVLAARTGSPGSLALLIAFQVAPAALSGVLLAPVVDRYPRRRLMILADVARAAAVGSLLIDVPSVGHVYAVAFCLGVCGAVFQPSLQASIPNLVDRDRLMAANSLISGTYYFAVMAGPPLGGFLVARFAASSVFAINAASFAVSAALIATVRIAHRPDVERKPVRAEIADGLRYVATTRVVRSLLIVMAIVIVAAGTKAPLESLFVLNTLSLGTNALGLLAGSWGLGMVFGAIVAPSLARTWSRERLFAWSIMAVGVAIAFASRADELPPVLLAWLVAGFANAVGDVCYETLLQERTPDRVRGRVFAASGVVVNASFLAGTGLSAAVGDASGVRAAYGVAAIALLMAALFARRLLPARSSRLRRSAPAGALDGSRS